MKHKKPLNLYGALLIGLGAFFISAVAFGGHVSAQQKNGTTSIKVSPVRSELTVKPGENTKVSAFITNTTSAPVEYKVIENDFVAGDEKGTPSIILDANSYAPTHSLKRFMQPAPNFTVGPGATQQVDVTIKVPANAQAGGYYGALRFTPSSKTGSMVDLSASATSLILMTVPGDLVENLNLTNFDVQKNGNAASNFRDSKNLELYMRFQNTGNVQVAPFGQINVIKGGKTVYKASFNADPPKSNVLPDSARRFTIPLKELGKFGKYTVQGNFTYGTTNRAIEIKKDIWIVPTMYLIFGGIGILVLALIIFLIVALIRAKSGGRRRSNRRY